MATKAEHMASALAHMEKSTISVDEYYNRVINGYKGKEYNFMVTEIYKAQKELEAAKNANPSIPPVESDTYLAPVRRCLFLTSDISRALETRDYLLIATADLGYRQFYSDSFIREAKSQDRLRVWCDCRPSPDGTPPQVALQWLRELGLPPTYFYGQGENPQEFDNAITAGARLLVAKADGLREDQLALLKLKKVLITNETYFNVNPDLIVSWENANAGIGGNCVACYESSTENAVYTPLRQQRDKGQFNLDHDSVYVAGMQTDDWDILVYG